MKFFDKYPDIEIIKALAKKKKVQIFLVGGFLRDYILGKEKMDFDFAVKRDSLKFARQFSNKIKGAYVLLDKERGCARVVKKRRGKIYTYDFSDFRATTFQKDLDHRDFTINTLSVDLSKMDDSSELNKLIKDYKGGLKDIKSKKIKMTSSKIYKEDPLRMMRAFSIKANLGFKIEPKTLKQIVDDKVLIKDVSYERIREELFKILESDRASAVIKEIDKIGLLDRIIPQVRIMYASKQKGSYHHLDVWPHSIETVVQIEKLFKEIKDKTIEELEFIEDIQQYLNKTLGGNHSRKALIKLASLLHDIGKPDTRKRERGRLSFHAHERVGKDIVRHVSKMLKLSTNERYAIEDMVFGHLRPGYLSNLKHPTERSIYRFFRDTGQESVSILLLSLADQRATRGPLTTEEDQNHHKKICLGLISTYFRKNREKPFIRLIDGNDLINNFKLKPSPLVGKILSEIEEKQNLGKITTKKEALNTAQVMIKKFGEK